MAKKPLSPAQQDALARGRAKRDANRQKQTPQTQTKAPEPQAQPTQAPQLLTFTPEQLQQLVTALTTNSSVVVDKSPSPLLSGGEGMRMNALGQIVGVTQTHNIDPTYYPNPIERLYDEFEQTLRTRRLGLRDNYFITWDITSKPYENKFGLSIQEPFFHTTLYQHMWDEDGNEMDEFIVVQTLHFNEDEQIAYAWAADNDFDVTGDNVRLLMDEARYFRVKAWLLDLFFPPRNFELHTDFHEEAIGGQIVKVVTKSNVKGFGNPTPKIKEEELS